ncbi:hypothetical protein BS50DRAFT_498329 [Corynespora cassiicola Philippines]|uniref:M protein, serotype 2.1 n=1 Tax=Corynespora cassiicola Philippines TaxID=1448308 RepID=A0A2T2NH12_CORCC|nr:hypothetical protein BS50DRAFT_498329 [Corynespora cassiicola Philippines]
MSTTARKPAPPGTPGRDNASKVSPSPGAAARNPARASTPTSTANAPNGVSRTRSPGSTSNLSMNTTSQADAQSDEARDEAAAFLQDLKERLQKAETDAEERQKQIEVLNSRLDEASKEQARLEERAHEEEERVESLENEKRELTRQHRELEGIYEAERAQTMKEKEEAQNKEEELQDTIQRLKETVANSKNAASSSDGEEGHLSRTPSFRNNPSRNSSTQNLEGSAASFAPPSSIQRSDSRNHSKLIHQKDKIIEGLRLELAEVQIKLVEMENAGGGRMRELEKQLLETRMTNARLMEDNESFQLLLGEKTLNGDLSRGDFLRESMNAHSEDRAPSRNGPATSLADELESADDGAADEAIRKLEGEIVALKDQNKALTLYINKIIGRLLTHQGFESVLGNDLEGESPGGAPNTNKELPPPPPKENDQPQGFLQRAKSVAMGGNRPKPRPMSFAPGSIPTQTVNEDPSTAPSIPLTRSSSTRHSSGQYSHRRSTSDVPGAANMVNNMVRSTPPAGPTSPGLVSPRNSFFGIPIGTGGNNSNPSSRVPSSGAAPIHEEKDDSKSVKSGDASIDTPSPPRRTETTAGSVMTGKQVRPLRLVQNEEEAMRARKAANRQSWFGGLFGGGEQRQEAPQ